MKTLMGLFLLCLTWLTFQSLKTYQSLKLAKMQPSVIRMVQVKETHHTDTLWIGPKQTDTVRIIMKKLTGKLSYGDLESLLCGNEHLPKSMKGQTEMGYNGFNSIGCYKSEDFKDEK